MQTNVNLLDFIQDSQLKDALCDYAAAYQQAYGNKPFVIGVMGKSGAGKSSLINALFHQLICKTGAVGGCTREVKFIDGKLGKMNIRLVDFPGIAENQKWNQEYVKLYERYIERVDYLFWVIKVDDRAILEDEIFYNQNLEWKYKQKVIFVLSQADKAEPKREWDYTKFMPSDKQLDHINLNRYRIYSAFLSNDIVAVANDYDRGIFKTYNFDFFFKKIFVLLGEDRKIRDNDDVVSISTSIYFGHLLMKLCNENEGFREHMIGDMVKTMNELNEVKKIINELG